MWPQHYFLGTFGIRLPKDILEKCGLYATILRTLVQKTDATNSSFQIV